MELDTLVIYMVGFGYRIFICFFLFNTYFIYRFLIYYYI